MAEECKTKRTELFCQEDIDHKGEKYWNHFYLSEMQVRMCQDNRHPKPILRCVVEEIEKHAVSLDKSTKDYLCSCGWKTDNVVASVLHETLPRHKDKNCYWAWWDNKDQRFSMIFRSKQMLEMCFPYGSKAEEDHGRGKVTPVIITILLQEVT